MIEKQLVNYKARVEEALKKELSRYSGSSFYKLLDYALEGGKRIRPIILLLSSEAFGINDEKPIDAAVAIELLHTESIIHDDIIDEETYRRNKVAFHIQFGYSPSILTADFVFAMILSIASRYNDSRISEEISNAALRMAEGEYNELLIDPNGKDLEWEKYIQIVEDKTASLFKASAKLGAIIANARPDQINALSDYGKCIGIAYQLKDDILDWGSSEKVTNNLARRMGEKELKTKMFEQMTKLAENAKRDLEIIPKNSATELLLSIIDFAVMRKH